MKYWDEKNKRLMTQEEKDAKGKTMDTVKESSEKEETTFLMGTEEPYEEKKPVKKSRK